VVVNDDATANAHTASRSLWLLIVGLVIAVSIVATRLARRRRETDISIRGDRTGPIRTDGGPALTGRS
jgi:ribose 1,5-bisphosphokinase PhnN